MIAAMSEALRPWYARGDYAGIGRRLLAVLTDAVVLLSPWVAMSRVLRSLHPATASAPAAAKVPMIAVVIFAVVVFLIISAYHIGLRRTRGGTLGYRVARIRLESAREERPSWATIARRYLISMIVPLGFAALGAAVIANAEPATSGSAQKTSPLAQGIFLGVVLAIFLATYWPVLWDARRRSAHDKWSGTWVVRADARPAGMGQAVFKATILGPIVLPYWDVEPAATMPVAGVSVPTQEVVR